MHIIKTTVLSAIFVLMLIGTAQAEDSVLKGVKLGFGFDRGFGITGSMGKFNGFLGNDGFAVDYIFNKAALKVDVDAPVLWYIGVGGYGDWGDGDLGVRMPVGVEVTFAERVDAYAQVIPRFRFNNNADFGLDVGIGVRYAF